MQTNFEYVDVAVGLQGYIRKTIDEVESESGKEKVLNIYQISDCLTEKEYMIGGVEPLMVGEVGAENIEKIISNNRIIGIGETGLDFRNPFAFRNKQIESFERHLEEAKKRGLPVIAKCESAFPEFIKVMEKYPDVAKRTVVTRFDGSLKELNILISMGCYIGVDDYIVDCFKNEGTILTMMLIPRKKLIPYTGSPYSRVTGLNGKRRENYPWNIKEIIRSLSDILMISENEMKSACLENTKELFVI